MYPLQKQDTNPKNNLCIEIFNGNIELFGITPELIYSLKYYAVVELGLSAFGNYALLPEMCWWIDDEKILEIKFWEQLAKKLDIPVANEILKKTKKICKQKGLILIDPLLC